MPHGMDPEELTDQGSSQASGPERRITFQLYEYWFGLAKECGIPPLKSLEPADIAPYRNNMVLMDLRDPENEPTLQVIGQLLLDDVGEDLTLRGVSEIPRRTLLSRITDHYMEVLGNESPVSFDAEFNNKAQEKIYYRGILLPFSDNGEKINFILGAIRWISEEDMKKAEAESSKPLPGVTSTPVQQTPAPETAAPAEIPDETTSEASLSQLQDQLDACRHLIQGQTPSDLRSRRSLYQVLGKILDFHKLCLSSPQNYNSILATENLKQQKRAPFTPALKLCFGRDYDKTRLTEYAATLAYAYKQNLVGDDLPDFLESFPGGIKGCVQAERQEKQDATGAPRPSRFEAGKEIAKNMPIIASFNVFDETELPDGGAEDLCLVLTRRDGSRFNVIKILREDEKTLKPIIKRLTKDSQT